MSLTGDEKTAPTRAGYIVCDTMAAMTAAFAVCAALYRREKTGEGEMIDVSMLDASLSTMASWPVSNYLNAGKVPVPMGNENHTASPSGAFRTGKGLLNIVNNEQKQWERLCESSGTRSGKPIRDLLTAMCASPIAPSCARCSRRRCRRKARMSGSSCSTKPACRRARSSMCPRSFDTRKSKAGSCIKRFENAPGVGRDVAVSRLGFRLSREQPDVDRPPPTLGRDTDADSAGSGLLGARD